MDEDIKAWRRLLTEEAMLNLKRGDQVEVCYSDGSAVLEVVKVDEKNLYVKNYKGDEMIFDRISGSQIRGGLKFKIAVDFGK